MLFQDFMINHWIALKFMILLKVLGMKFKELWIFLELNF